MTKKLQTVTTTPAPTMFAVKVSITNRSKAWFGGFSEAQPIFEDEPAYRFTAQSLVMLGRSLTLAPWCRGVDAVRQQPAPKAE